MRCRDRPRGGPGARPPGTAALSMSPTVPPTSVITTSTPALGHRADAPLDLVGDVRDHLHGVAEVLAAALLGDDRRVHLPGGDVRRAGRSRVEEPLVVPDVEVGLGAVVGDEHLAVLERVHRPGIDVEVRVQLLHRHPQAAGRSRRPRGGRQALPEGGGDASGDEHMLGRLRRTHGPPDYRARQPGSDYPRRDALRATPGARRRGLRPPRCRPGRRASGTARATRCSPSTTWTDDSVTDRRRSLRDHHAAVGERRDLCAGASRR